LIAIFFALAAASPPETDMLAQFRSGKVLCSSPDASTKTCHTIDRLTIRQDGVMMNTGETLIAPDKPITMEVTSQAHFEAGAMCGVISLADIQKGIVRASGVPLPPDRNALVLEKIGQAFQAVLDQPTCESLRVLDGKLVKFGQVQNVDLTLAKPVRWISPDEGYRVAPPSP
jgi:hypothetical protein